MKLRIIDYFGFAKFAPCKICMWKILNILNYVYIVIRKSEMNCNEFSIEHRKNL